MKLKSSLLLIILVGVLVACGGSGGDSSTNEPPNTGITADTKEFAVAAQETMSQILASESDLALPTPSPASFSVADILKEALTISPQKQITTSSASGSLLKPYATETKSGSKEGECGGTSDFIYTHTWDDVNYIPYTFDYVYTLDNYCLLSREYEIVYNGEFTVYIDYTDENNGDTEIVFDISYTTNIPLFPSGTLRYTEICTIRDGVENCNTGVYVSERTTYYTSDVTVSGNASSGYNASYTITDSEGNIFYVEFTGLTPCENGNVGSGRGSVTYNGDEVISIEFISCDEFVVTYNGNSETYSQ